MLIYLPATEWFGKKTSFSKRQLGSELKTKKTKTNISRVIIVHLTQIHVYGLYNVTGFVNIK